MEEDREEAWEMLQDAQEALAEIQGRTFEREPLPDPAGALEVH